MRLFLANLGFAAALLVPALSLARSTHERPGESAMTHLLTAPEHAVGIYLAVIFGVGFSWFIAQRDWRSPDQPED
jgi:hypothetical protein